MSLKINTGERCCTKLFVYLKMKSVSLVSLVQYNTVLTHFILLGISLFRLLLGFTAIFLCSRTAYHSADTNSFPFPLSGDEN